MGEEIWSAIDKMEDEYLIIKAFYSGKKTSEI